MQSLRSISSASVSFAGTVLSICGIMKASPFHIACSSDRPSSMIIVPFSIGRFTSLSILVCLIIIRYEPNWMQRWTEVQKTVRWQIGTRNELGSSSHRQAAGVRLPRKILCTALVQTTTCCRQRSAQVTMKGEASRKMKTVEFLIITESVEGRPSGAQMRWQSWQGFPSTNYSAYFDSYVKQRMN